MEIRKVFWGIRGILYKLSFGKFGNLSYIGRSLYLRGKKGIFVGDKVRIYPGARMETSQGGRIVLEDGITIAQNFHITASNEKIVVGKETAIAGNVYITNIDHNYREIGVHVLKQKSIISTTRIGEYCYIGYGAAIQAGTILGKQCIVGANSVVRGTFPDYCVIVGAPAKIVKRYNEDTGNWESVV